jgi:hypothetical protein
MSCTSRRRLANNVTGGSEQAESSSSPSKRKRLDSDQQGLPLSRLEGSSAIYEIKSSAVRCVVSFYSWLASK